MRKITLLFFIVLASVYMRLNAQCSTCTPVFSACPPAGGLCNKLDTGYANHPYDKVINFFMPQTLNQPSILAQCQCNLVKLRHITVTGVSGLPTGIGYLISNNGYFDVQNGDSLGCGHFCGTALVPGMYPVTVYLQADVTAIGTPIGDVNQNNVPQSYNDTLTILPDTTAGVSSFTYGNNGSTACDSITITLSAKLTAPQPNMTRWFWNLGNGQTSQAQNPGTFTYVNTSQTKPDTFPITLSTVFYNYTVKKVNIAHISGGYCGDVEELTCLCASAADSPDPYLKFNVLGFNNSGSYASNTCTNVNFNNLNLSIPLGTQQLAMEIWDKDNGPPFGSADDQLGTDTLNIHLGQENYSDNNEYGYVQFDTVAGTTVTETLYVIVNPTPVIATVLASQDTFCSGDSARISLNNAYPNCTFDWYRDTTYLVGQNDSVLFTTVPGKFKVKITNALTGCSSESPWKTVAMAQSPSASISIIFNGTKEFVSPFPASGFAVDWYYNGNLVTGQNGKFLPYLGNGVYEAQVYNLSYPSCRTIATPDTVNVSGISDIENAVYNLSVFPNPNNGKFNLQFATEDVQTISLNIFDEVGRIVFERKLENFTGNFNQEISLDALSKGVYILAVETANGKQNRKIVVQ